MDLFFCHCTSTEGTYLRQFENSNKVSQVLIFEKNTHFCEIFGTTARTFKVCMVKTTAKMLEL